ncbi:CBS domain-containing protein [Amycolatopsis magusensis]|uniref:CBS domain-containing protein n=1 Tax=Amycolatopsis magusensis TaxID=882444 RepID=UPI0024A83679|nr:CBS domain-containing protein [Amycolatopsis magusensis]MDI5975901.1 CBS domain-containing protein [Amycolatopsis magusensis]
MLAREIMTRPAVAVSPETPVREATAMLIEHGFAGMPVVNEDEQVVGVFTEADALRADFGAATATVDAVMAKPVEVVSPDTDVAEIARHMLIDRLRCIPVVEEGVLAGVISRRDLLRPLVRHDDAIAAHLHALLDDYSGHRKRWSVDVVGGVVSVGGGFADAAERQTIRALAHTVPGVSQVELH